MIKSELIQKISTANPHLFHKDIERIVNVIFDEITEALARGDRVELRGFGAFTVKYRGPRQGRNPRTGHPSRSTRSSCRSSRPARSCARSSTPWHQGAGSRSRSCRRLSRRRHLQEWRAGDMPHIRLDSVPSSIWRSTASVV